MKTTLKILSLLLAVIMCTCAFVGCKDDIEEETADSEIETLAEGSNELEARNFGGKEFRILDANDYPSMHINFAEDMDGNAVEQALYKRDVYIEGRNNVDIVYTQIENIKNEGITAFTNAYDGGERLYDLVITTASEDNGGRSRFPTLATTGRFTNLRALPTLDLDQKWWSKEMNEAISLGGKMYFTTGDIMASVYDAPMAVFANKDLLAENKIEDDLYQKVKDGEWTLEYMAGITKNLNRDKNYDNIFSAADDFFGVVAQPNRMTAVGLLVGMGYSNSYISGTDIVINDDVETLTNMCAAIKNTLGTITVNKADEVINTTFKKGNAVFLVHLVQSANHDLRDMASDFMVLPMPKSNVTQETYRSYINGWVDCFVGVPSFSADTADEADFYGYMLEVMARASYDIVRPVAFDQVVMLQSTRDPEAVEMLEIIYNTLYLDFQGIYDFGDYGYVIQDHVFKGKELASSLVAKKSTAVKEAETQSQYWLNPDSSQN